MKNKIIHSILLALCLNLTAADTSADEQLANRLYEVSGTFKDSLADTTGKTKDYTQQEKLDILPVFKANEYAQSGILEIVRDAQSGILEIVRDAQSGILEIVRDAQGVTPRYLQFATADHLDAIDDQNMRWQAAIELLEAANFFAIEPIMQATAQAVANYLKTPDALAKFNQDPEQFIDNEIALAPELQEIISEKLLNSPIKRQFIKPYFSKKVELKYSGVFSPYSIVFSATGNQIAVGYMGGSINIWNTQTNELSHSLEGNGFDPVLSMAFSPINNVLVAGFRSGTIKFWNTQSGITHIILGGANSVSSIAFNPSGNQLVVGYANGSFQMWNPHNRALLNAIHVDLSLINSVAFNPAGDRLAVGYKNGTIQLWDPITLEHINTLGEPSADFINAVISITFNATGNLLAVGYRKGTIKVWDLEAPILSKVLRTPANRGFAYSLAFSPLGNQLTTIYNKGSIKVWNLHRVNGRVEVAQADTLEEKLFENNTPSSLIYSQTGNQLITATESQDDAMLLTVWNIPDIKINELIKKIDLAQALYIYYLALEKINKRLYIHPFTDASKEYFKLRANEFPKVIQDIFDIKEITTEELGGPSCAIQ